MRYKYVFREVCEEYTSVFLFFIANRSHFLLAGEAGMDIGLRIAYLRRQANLTQAKLADMLHVSPKTVSKWENGYGLPDIKIIPDLATALGVDADFLLTGRSKSVLAPCERAAAAEAKQSSLSQWAPPPKGVYRLRLRQRTHSNLSGWVLFFAILMLILALMGRRSRL